MNLYIFKNHHILRWSIIEKETFDQPNAFSCKFNYAESCNKFVFFLTDTAFLNGTNQKIHQKKIKCIKYLV